VLESALEAVPGPASAGRAGDVLLENENIRVVVSAPDHALGEAASGGHILDAAPARGSDFWGFSYLVLSDEAGERQPRYVSLELLPPDREGAPAGVRVSGSDTRGDEIRVETLYLLGPGDAFVTVRTTYFWAPLDEKAEIVAFDRLSGGRARPFLEGEGFLEASSAGGDSLLAGEAVLFAADGESYAWSSAASRGVTRPESGVVRMRIVPRRTADRTLVFERRLYVEEGDLADLARRMAPGRLIAASGRVVNGESGEPAAGAAIEVRDAGGIRTVARSGADGAFRVELPPGTYTVVCLSPGGAEVSRKDVELGESDRVDLSFSIGKIGTVGLRIEDGAGTPLPARVTIRDASNRPLAREQGRAAPQDVFFLDEGIGSVALLPGEYTLVASHGLDHSIDERRVVVGPGSEEAATFRLAPEVDLGGLVAADLRVHTLAGLGGPATAAEQAAAARSEGIDLIVFADEGRVFADALSGASRRPVAVPGEEIVLPGIGRFGAFPLSEEERLAPRGGAGSEGKTPASVFSMLRASPSRPLIQALRPRKPGSGYFEAMHLDPVTALSTNIEFDASFDLLEVASAEGIEEASAVLGDWFHLLNQGQRLFASGNSGSADRERNPLGVPRNYVEVESAGEGSGGLIESVRAGRFFFTTGPILRFRIDGDRRAGDLVTDTDGLVDAALDVDAASWVGVDEIRIFANGSVLTERRAGRRSGARVFTLRETLAIHGDTWLVAAATSAKALDPVYLAPDGGPILPVAVSNPIWVDFDGDGEFDAPGVR
jgi:hypothetical protein